MLGKQAIKIGEEKSSMDNFFFTEVGKDVREANLSAMKNMKSFADMFPVNGSVIKEDLATLMARAKKDPAFLKNDIKTAYGVEYA